MRKPFLAILIFLLTTGSVYAQEASSALEKKINWDPLEINIYKFGNISQSKLDLILTLMEESGMIANLQESFRQTYESVEPADKEKILDILNFHEIVESIIPLYDKYYSELDLQQIVAFYKSPGGKKMLEVGPTITQEAILAAAMYLRDKLRPPSPAQ